MVSTLPNPVWEESCYYTELATGVSCDGIEPSFVLVVPDKLMDAKFGRGTLGFFYPTGRIVYVRESLDEATQYEVIVHENTHYILDRYDPWRLKWDRCASEEAARLTTDLYMGRPYSSKWKEWYNCPKGESPW